MPVFSPKNRNRCKSFNAPLGASCIRFHGCVLKRQFVRENFHIFSTSQIITLVIFLSISILNFPFSFVLFFAVFFRAFSSVCYLPCVLSLSLFRLFQPFNSFNFSNYLNYFPRPLCSGCSLLFRRLCSDEYGCKSYPRRSLQRALRRAESKCSI